LAVPTIFRLRQAYPERPGGLEDYFDVALPPCRPISRKRQVLHPGKACPQFSGHLAAVVASSAVFWFHRGSALLCCRVMAGCGMPQSKLTGQSVPVNGDMLSAF